MSDLKRSCPACDAWTTAVGVAFRDGDSCPYCGLPAEAAAALDEARDRNVSQKLIERVASAEVRAVKAEGALGNYRAAIAEAMVALREVSDVER